MNEFHLSSVRSHARQELASILRLGRKFALRYPHSADAHAEKADGAVEMAMYCDLITPDQFTCLSNWIRKWRFAAKAVSA
jgi:hypothetical protein